MILHTSWDGDQVWSNLEAQNPYCDPQSVATTYGLTLYQVCKHTRAHTHNTTAHARAHTHTTVTRCIRSALHTHTHMTAHSHLGPTQGHACAARTAIHTQTGTRSRWGRVKATGALWTAQSGRAASRLQGTSQPPTVHLTGSSY